MNRDAMQEQTELLSWLLRSPKEVAAHCRRNGDLAPLAGVSLGAIVVGGAAFGAAVGSFRGSEQIAYAALKIPLAMTLALALCVPAFHALAVVFGRAWSLRTVVALTLAAAARASLLLLAFSPVLWLLYDLHLGYHAGALAAAGAYAVAGLAAFSILVYGLGPGRGRFATVVGFALVFFAVAGQTGWILRPYLVRPRSTEVPFVRSTEGGFIDAVWTSVHSSLGIYAPGERDRWGDEDRGDALGEGSL